MIEETEEYQEGSHPPSPPENWRAIPADLSPLAAAATLSAGRTRLWSLTLEARQIPFRIERDGSGWRLLVPQEAFVPALEELRLFEEKNRNWPPPLPPTPPAVADNILITLSVLFLLAIFHNLHQLNLAPFHLSASEWVSRGTADAGEIMHGQWWRAVTALTLHADGLHLLGNLTIGGVFIVLLCRALGSGLAWSLLLASGAIGNLLNAVVQSPYHRSIGASTTVFGAVGLLAAINLLYDHQRLRQRWYQPLAAAVALLALLGSEGDKTDLGAHLFGFATGIILGLATGYLRRGKARPGAVVNALLALTCLGLVGGAWWSALHTP